MKLHYPIFDFFILQNPSLKYPLIHVIILLNPERMASTMKKIIASAFTLFLCCSWIGVHATPTLVWKTNSGPTETIVFTPGENSSLCWLIENNSNQDVTLTIDNNPDSHFMIFPAGSKLTWIATGNDRYYKVHLSPKNPAEKITSGQAKATLMIVNTK